MASGTLKEVETLEVKGFILTKYGVDIIKNRLSEVHDRWMLYDLAEEVREQFILAGLTSVPLQAATNIVGLNLDLLSAAIQHYGESFIDTLKNGATFCAEMIRNYLLADCCVDALEDIMLDFGMKKVEES